jgi:hypothetical protein
MLVIRLSYYGAEIAFLVYLPEESELRFRLSR